MTSPTGKKMKDWKTTFDKEFDHWPNCDGYDSEGNCNCGFTQVRDFISSLLSSQLKEVLGAADEAIEEEYYNNWGKVKDSDQLGNIRCFADNIKERIKAELSQLAEGEREI